jgi:hypothetical protein
MTLFINLRASANGGIVADEALAWDMAGDGDQGALPISAQDFDARIAGRHLLLATHGFNVDQEDGTEALAKWSQLCELPDTFLFVGVLWPGDSRFLPVMDYVYEGAEAISSGKLLATYLNQNAGRALSISFVSHSLGARTVLETISRLSVNPRRLVLMAPAIENDCLSKEYADAAKKIAEIYVLASKEDDVLKWAFPPGNLVGQIVMQGHPYDRTALGRSGPALPIPADLNVAPWQIPSGWEYGHGDYLPKGAIAPAFALPVMQPGPDSVVPIAKPLPEGWKSAWSAGVVSTLTP